ncbi:MAG: hypothetical protein WCD07_02150 [Burkholderiales bacterium]
MTNTVSSSMPKNIRLGLIAGISGGLIEILWISLYSTFIGSDASLVARGVTQALGVESTPLMGPATLGIIIHLSLSAALGILLVILTKPLFMKLDNLALELFCLITLLALVWAVNFFVVLPVLSPAFTQLVPYPVSLLSKLLFGCAAALAIHSQSSRRYLFI